MQVLGRLYLYVVLFVVLCSMPVIIPAACEEFSKSPQQMVEDYAEMFNEYREERGRGPLAFTSELNVLAQIRVREIQVDFSHTGIVKYNLGENIASGVHTDWAALYGWSKSSDHRANMLGPYRCSGYARENGYAVQLFDSQGEPLGWQTVEPLHKGVR